MPAQARFRGDRVVPHRVRENRRAVRATELGSDGGRASGGSERRFDCAHAAAEPSSLTEVREYVVSA